MGKEEEHDRGENEIKVIALFVFFPLSFICRKAECVCVCSVSYDGSPLGLISMRLLLHIVLQAVASLIV